MSHTATCALDPHHTHEEPGHTHGGHSHGPFVDPSVIRSRAGIKAVSISLVVLAITAAAQTAIYVVVLSVALLADLIHNFGDALTAIPLGLAFFLRSARGERWAGFAVVLAIVVSAAVALGPDDPALHSPAYADSPLVARRCGTRRKPRGGPAPPAIAAAVREARWT